MKSPTPITQFILWQSESLFNIDFASYSLSHHYFPRHFHDHYVIELVVNGIDSFYCDGRNYKAADNQLVLINPGEVHTGNTIADIPLQYYSLYPDRKALQQVADAMGISLPRDFNFQRSLLDPCLLSQKLKSLFDSLATPVCLLEQQELFFDCMHLLLQPFTHELNLSSSLRDHRVQSLIDYMRLHYKEDISLQQLADLARLNPFHLVRLFKKTIGLSPYDYLLIVRSEKAKQLLRKGFKVREAATESGFYDSSHLNRLFQKTMSASPKSFRSSKSQYRTSLAR